MIFPVISKFLFYLFQFILCDFEVTDDVFDAMSFNVHIFFIVLMILFIFSFFDILPNLCDFINFHRNTSRVALARSGDHVLLYSFLLREASVYSTHVEISLSSASIFGMSLMVG